MSDLYRVVSDDLEDLVRLSYEEDVMDRFTYVIRCIFWHVPCRLSQSLIHVVSIIFIFSMSSLSL
ncbi:unnamed protein product [Arabidopsis halleri]